MKLITENIEKLYKLPKDVLIELQVIPDEMGDYSSLKDSKGKKKRGAQPDFYCLPKSLDKLTKMYIEFGKKYPYEKEKGYTEKYIKNR